MRRRYALDSGGQIRYPIGRKPGLKKDKPSRIMERCNSVRAVIDRIPEAHWEELAASQWHASKDLCYLYTSDQNGLGSCASDSEHNTAHACDTRQGQPLVVHNPLFAYYTTSGGRDNGSVIGDNLEHGREHGRCPEEVWPRSKGFRAKPSAEAYAIAKFFRLREFFYVENTAEFVSALLQGYFVHAGYSGHAVSFSRYLGKGLLWFKNSWGAWGDNGFGTLKLSSVYFGYGAYAYKDTVPYWHAKRGWGRIEDDGSFTACPWQPTLNQEQLAEAVNVYQRQLLKTRGAKQAAQQLADLYRASLLTVEAA